MKFLLILNFVWIFSPLESKHPPGHLEPLGSHQAPVGEIHRTDVVPSPQNFFDEFAFDGKPVLFNGAAKNMPAYIKWTDEYLSEKFGQEGCDVEEGKKENRSLATFHFKLQDFIRRYKKEDIYMVESLPVKMREEYALLKSIACGGFTDVLQDAVVWFSSGGTKSVLHYDSVDNINCLFDGTKELLMIDKSHLAQAHIDVVNGAFSSVDVDKVDMYKFPGLQTIPYYKVFMEPGDCLFIPSKWVHQVRSYGGRNLAVNIWWAHFIKFNHTDCEHSPYKDNDLIPLSHFDFHPQEAMRHGTLQSIGDKPVSLKQWMKFIQAEFDAHIEERTLLPRETLEQNFHEIDTNKDGFVTAEEIYDIKYDDLERLLGYMEEDEGEEEEQDEQTEETSADSTDETTQHDDTEHTEL